MCEMCIAFSFVEQIKECTVTNSGGVVLACIDPDVFKSVLILQHFSRSDSAGCLRTSELLQAQKYRNKSTFVSQEFDQHDSHRFERLGPPLCRPCGSGRTRRRPCAPLPATSLPSSVARSRGLPAETARSSHFSQDRF